MVEEMCEITSLTALICGSFQLGNLIDSTLGPELYRKVTYKPAFSQTNTKTVSQPLGAGLRPMCRIVGRPAGWLTSWWLAGWLAG